MNIKRAVLLSAVLVAASAAVGVWAFAALPPGALMAVHFGAAGDANGWAGKGVGLALLPATGVAMTALLTGVFFIAPRRRNMAASAGPYGVVMTGVMAILLVAQASVAARAMDPAFDVTRWLFLATGILFAVIGNLLGKVRHNYVLGIRTPWTLANERVWDKTHRFTGRLMVAAGVVLAAGAAVTGRPALLIGLLAACAAVPAVAGTVYSWRLYRSLCRA